VAKKDLIEIFGHAPRDHSKDARLLWDMDACPFTNLKCTKTNHDKTITYGVCSLTSPIGDVVICPNRFYGDNYAILKAASKDAFGSIPVMTFQEYVAARATNPEAVVLLGQNSGKEVKLGQKLSMDWVLAHVKDRKLIKYTGIEVQSIDITNNYRDAWHGYKNMSETVSSSNHGLNWANVHKRLIPQIIRKGLIYTKSQLTPSGMYFILPDTVYQKFEEVIGADIPLLKDAGSGVLTVMTYSLGSKPKSGEIRSLDLRRHIRFSLEEFSQRFISGANLPSGEDLDDIVRSNLGL